MSIKLKLLLTYTGLFILSLGLLYLLLMLGITALSSPSKDDRAIYQAIAGRIQQNPNQTSQPGYFRQLEQELRIGDGEVGIVVRKGKSLIHTSEFLRESVYKSENYRDFTEAPKYPGQIYGDPDLQALHPFLNIQQFDFHFPDGAPGSVFILASSTQSLIRSTNNFLLILIVSVSVLLGLLLYFNTRSIIRPLNHLKQASDRIRSGDLNTPIEFRGKNEIGKFAAAFEEMRIRLKESLETQKRYEANRKAMVAGISQNLKTPVSHIKSFVAAMMDGVAQPDEVQSGYMKIIDAEAAEIDRAINELFLYSKLELKKVPFQFETVNLTGYFRDFVEEWRLANGNQSGTIRFAAPPGPIFVIADRSRLTQILQLTIRNLAQPNPSDSPLMIDLAVKEENKTAVITFHKEILGLKKGKEAFPWFTPGESGADPALDESDLELAIVRLIIEAHGGKIGIEVSDQVGSVAFSLPKASDTGKS